MSLVWEGTSSASRNWGKAQIQPNLEWPCPGSELESSPRENLGPASSLGCVLQAVGQRVASHTRVPHLVQCHFCASMRAAWQGLCPLAFAVHLFQEKPLWLPVQQLAWSGWVFCTQGSFASLHLASESLSSSRRGGPESLVPMRWMLLMLLLLKKLLEQQEVYG